jgi:hypothetical protein
LRLIVIDVEPEEAIGAVPETPTIDPDEVPGVKISHAVPVLLTLTDCPAPGVIVV